MCTKLHLLAAAVSLAITCNAEAGQREASATFDSNPDSSTGKSARTQPLKPAAIDSLSETWGSTGYRIAAASSFGRLLSDTPADYFPGKYYTSPLTTEPPTADSSLLNKNHTIGDSGFARNNNFLGSSGDAGSELGHKLGDDVGWINSNTFGREIDYTGDLWKVPGDLGGYSSCSVPAVPEPNEWLLLLSGLGLVAFISMLRKQEVAGA